MRRTTSLAAFLGFLSIIMAACGGGGLAPTAAPIAAPVAVTPNAAETQQQQPRGTYAIVMDASSSGPVVTADDYGANVPTWYTFTSPWVNPSLEKAGIHLIRFPGGSESDAYHWENGGSLCANQGGINAGSTFDRFMTKVAAPAHLDIAITLNYGSNRTCNGGGDPAEAGAWVAYAKSKGYNVPYWTVGNENYGSWEYDLHSAQHDPATYAQAVKTGYYPAVKAANPAAKLGVVADFDYYNSTTWNDIVFTQSGPFDFVEVHYYPEYLHDSDSYLLGAAIDAFVGDIDSLRAEMTKDGLPPAMPIYLGEFNNDSGNEGKQSVSIVNGLFLGQLLAAAIDEGIAQITWWLAYGSCDQSGDYSKKLYGWQHFGSEGLFSDSLPDTYQCTNAPRIPGGTPYPTGRVMALMSQNAPAGSTVRTVAVPRTLGTKVRGFGFATKTGYTLALFNNTLRAISVQAKLSNASKRSMDATTWTYGKAQYDLSKSNRWVGPVSKHLGTIPVKSLPLLLPPYSVTFVTLQ